MRIRPRVATPCCTPWASRWPSGPVPASAPSSAGRSWTPSAASRSGAGRPKHRTEHSGSPWYGRPMAESPEQLARRLQLARACVRRLSGEDVPTIAEKLADLASSPYDLDEPTDRYGNGPVTVLEERVAALLGKPAALFFPTGIMTTQVALRILAERTGNPVVAAHPQSHIEQHEHTAYATLGGLRTVWPTTAPRQPTADEVRAVSEPFGTLMVELPLRDPGFLLPTWDELVALVGAARERGARVHF